MVFKVGKTQLMTNSTGQIKRSITTNEENLEKNTIQV